ncbi:hypothetical protein HNQ94_001173 [Salirhabdus euzebyi]|uniref:YitT family protein n=1 Tax=Salirhabdus euzebyi TaxID=394506 RepID=A0A841PUP2_9BACI|nr:DUF6198 family protein [Salirhabdus euzebyi]MBB6452727.1 hypothetical protein [Salirhabdus euzebyi]
MREHIIRFSTYVIGLIILSFGITLTIKAGLGTGAWDALNVGLSKIKFTVGTWVILVGIILIIVNAILMKKRPDLYAIITIFIVGFCIDFWLYLLNPNAPELLWVKVLLFVCGASLLAFGVSVYLQAKFAPVPIDNLMIAIHTRFGFGLSTSKTIAEVVALTFAFLFRGPIGIGTIIVTFSIGPLIHVFYPRIEKVLKQFQ